MRASAPRGDVTVGRRTGGRIIAIASALVAPAAGRAWGIMVPGGPRPWSSSPRMPKRARGITLRLSPTSSEERTRFRLEGTLPAALPPPALHQLLSLLVYWSGRPLHAVLSAGGPVGWFEIWAAALSEAPEPHVTVEFEAAKDLDDPR